MAQRYTGGHRAAGAGARKSPEQAARVFTTLCELREEPETEIADALLENTRALFGITL